LTEKSDEIKTILAQPRNISPPKPRVIRIEESEEIREWSEKTSGKNRNRRTS